MSKLKTHKGAAKRFKVNGSGKVIHKRATKRHCLGHRTTKNKRHLRPLRSLNPDNVEVAVRMVRGS